MSDRTKDWPPDHEAFLRAARPERVELPAGPVEYVVFGEGPAVLALHGAMGGYDQGLILARTIGPPGCRYVAPSRPGYLGTPMASGPEPESEADLLAALLDALGIDDALVMAVSGGGPTALHFGLRHPDRCRGLVLASTVSGPNDVKIPFSFTVMQWLGRIPFVADRIRARMARDPDAAAGRGIPDEALRRRTLADPHAGPLLRALTLSTADAMHRRLAGTNRDFRVAASRSYPLESLTVPVLAVHGTDDPMASFDHAEHLVERLPGTGLVRLEGGGHDAIFTHRAEVRPRVAAFVTRTETAATARRPRPPGSCRGTARSPG